MKENWLKKLDWLLLPMVGLVGVIVAWYALSATFSKELPNPSQTWATAKPYIRSAMK